MPNHQLPLFSDAGGLNSGALFSECRQFRYTLWRRWNWSRDRFCAFIGLNPSTADECVEDPTMRRCIDFARRWGCSGFWMLNLFAKTTPYPKEMKAHPDPIGPENDFWIQTVHLASAFTVVAWGANGGYLDRNLAVEAMLGRTGKPLYCLGRTNQGLPRHPLFVPAATELELYVPGCVQLGDK